MKIIKNSILTFLVLLSITAVLGASVQNNFSLSGTDPNSTILNHGKEYNFTFNATFNATSGSIEFDPVDISYPTNANFLTLNDYDFELNSTNNEKNLTYIFNISEHTAPGEYNYTLTYENQSNGADEYIHLLSITVDTDDTLNTNFFDNTLEIKKPSTSENAILKFNNTGNLNYNVTILDTELILNKNNELNLTGLANETTFTINAGSENNISINYSTNASTEFGKYNGILTYSANGINKSTGTLELFVLPESHNDELELNFELEDITNDDKDTYPGDYIRISDINIDNKYSDKDESIEDITVEYNVYRVSDGDDIIEEEYSESFDLEEDKDTDNFDIEFQVPYDAESGDYIVEVIVTGEISSDDPNDGDEISNRHYETFNVDRDSRHVIPTGFKLLDSCTSNPTLVVDLTNIGTSDLDEDDDIYVRVKISELDISEWHYFNDSIDSEDTEKLEIELELPQNTADGLYSIVLTSKHDGNSNSNKDGSELSETFNLDCGNDRSDNSDIMITGKTSEEGKSGSQTKYTLSLTNRKDIAVKYDLAVDEFNWGTAIVNPTSVTLQPGATTSFDVFVMPGENAQESNSLTLDINQNGKTVLSKNLEMNLPQTGIRSLFGGSSNRQSESNPVLALLIIAMAYIGIREYKMVQKSNNKASKKRK